MVFLQELLRKQELEARTIGIEKNRHFPYFDGRIIYYLCNKDKTSISLYLKYYVLRAANGRRDGYNFKGKGFCNISRPVSISLSLKSLPARIYIKTFSFKNYPCLIRIVL